MKFAITATIASLALATLGFGAPAHAPAVAGHPSPNTDDDWQRKVAWDGKTGSVSFLFCGLLKTHHIY